MSDESCRHSSDNSVGRHIFGDHTAGSDEGKLVDRHAAEDGAADPDRSVAADESWPIQSVWLISGLEPIGRYRSRMRVSSSTATQPLRRDSCSPGR